MDVAKRKGVPPSFFIWSLIAKNQEGLTCLVLKESQLTITSPWCAAPLIIAATVGTGIARITAFSPVTNALVAVTATVVIVIIVTHNDATATITAAIAGRSGNFPPCNPWAFGSHLDPPHCQTTFQSD
jgi:choline-glycine betaine transporter